MPAPSTPIQTTPGTFSLEDLRFFHHFMVEAHPPWPIGCTTVWREIAAVAHGHEYLAHAMLGLAASHLTSCTNVDYSSQALGHRLQAIRLFRDRVSQPCRAQADGDALFATTMVLSHQATFMDDAMIELMVMTRGCDIVARTVMPSFSDSAFRSFSLEGHVDNMRNLVRAGEGGESSDKVVSGFVGSVALLGPLCKSTTELGYLAALQRVVKTASVVDPDVETALLEFTQLFMTPSYMGGEEFRVFTSLQNWTAQLLLVHMFLLDQLMGEHLLRIDQKVLRKIRKNVLVGWVESLDRRLPTEYSRFMEWPRTYSKILRSAD